MKVVFVALLLLAQVSFAGRDCRVSQITCDMKINGDNAAHVLYQKLEQIRVAEEKAGRLFEVAIVGRMGTDLKNIKVFKDNLTVDQIVSQATSYSGSTLIQNELDKLYDNQKFLKYSHIGIFVYNHPRAVTYGRGYHWWVTHELNQCQTVSSDIFHESTSFFFYDDPDDYGAEILVPKPEIQKALMKIVAEEIKKQDRASLENVPGPDFPFHSNPYNAFAMADNEINDDKKHRGQQNSNQFVLEVLASAISESLYSQRLETRADVQRFLKSTGYKPSTVQATGFKASFLNTPMAPKSMDTSSQKYPLFSLGEIITALSVEEYLKNGQFLSRPIEEVHLKEFYLRVVSPEEEKTLQKKKMEEIKKTSGKYPHPCSPEVMGDK